ncbi:MAG TPA: S8 family serine peptidase [Steroidobacteraceae bacterium]|nr:S8 family serine peptidase [Steroidobacteraceae bacterium]
MRPLVRCILLLGPAACGGLGAPVPAAAAAAASAAELPRIVVAFANQPEAPPGPAGATGRRYSGDGYRVAQSAQQQARSVAAAYSLREVANWPIRALSMHCVIYEITNGRPVAEVLAALAHDRRVLLAEPLHEFHTLAGPPAAPPYNDPLYDLQTNLGALGIPDAHRQAEGAGVRIALIDTGVDARHPDLAGRILHTRSFVGTHRSAFGSLRHGTAMAGIIAAVANNHIGIVGIAPLAQLEVFEACWQLEPDADAATCNTLTLAQALAAALESGAPLVNLSLGGPADPLLTALIDAGLRHGVVFVGAAGGDTAFPSAIPGVIGAAPSEGVVPRGAFAAPGQHVLTLRPGSQYDFESGTSVAAAELSGVIALLMSAAPQRLTVDAIRSLLWPVSAAGAANPPLVNAAASLGRLTLEEHERCAAAHGRLQRPAPCTVSAGHVLDGL